MRSLDNERALLTTQQQINPEGLLFDPGTPIPPTTTGITPISWAPPIGYNLTYSPDKRAGARHETLRTFADTCVPLRVVIEQLKREMIGLAVDIMPIDDTGDAPDTDARREELRAWLHQPDGELSWQQWLNAVMEDLLVIGTPALARMRSEGGDPLGLRPINAENIAPIPTATGRMPYAPAAAYYQTLYGLPYREYTRDELIYKPFNYRTFTPFGFGPVEQTLMTAVQVLNANIFENNSYTESNIPPGLVQLPEGMGVQQIKEWQAYFDALMTGNQGELQRMKFVPFGSKYEPLKQRLPFQYEMWEFFTRIFAWALGVAATPVAKTSSLGKGSEGLSQEALAAGVKPMQAYIEAILDEYLDNADRGLTVTGESFPMGFGESRYTVEWIEQREENRAQQLAEDTQLVDRAVLTINEVRINRGVEPFDVPEADMPMVKTATGYVALKGLSEPKPAPVPFGVSPGGPGVPAPGEEPKPGEKGSEQEAPDNTARADVARWRRKAKADQRAGRDPRPFVSSSIPPATRHWIERNIAAGDVTRAFQQPDKASMPRALDSVYGMAVAATGKVLWDGLLRKAVKHYLPQAIADAKRA